MLIIWRNRIIKFLILAAFVYVLACQLSIPVYLTTVDIGRHLKNGEMILSGHYQALYQNFYSFTHPQYPFINHHWLAGVIFYVIHALMGWEGLCAFYLIIVLAGYLFFYKTARMYTSFGVVMLLSVAGLLIMADRKEIRPEGFSVLFLGIYFYILALCARRNISLSSMLWVLVPLQVMWVNIHIFFFLGPVLMLCFAIQQRRGWREVGILLAVNVINPSFIHGALTPFNGLKGFGYNLAENQTVWFMIKRFPHDPTFKIELGLLVLSAMALGWMLIKQWKQQWVMGVFYFLMMVAGFKAVRLMSPFSFVWLIMGAQAIGQHKKISLPAACIAGGLIMVFLVAPQIISFYPIRNTLTLELAPNTNASAYFFKEARLQGPIFSNYDIGGYLIYHLYPQERVFVDNRQEAFPPDFFKQTYIPMQEDDDVWKEKLARYNFQIIYFYRHDLTPWGQSFLIKRISDPQWAPIFVDAYTIIMAKRNGVNQPIINTNELPQTMFGVSNTTQ